jgi:hypothetical protein
MGVIGENDLLSPPFSRVVSAGVVVVVVAANKLIDHIKKISNINTEPNVTKSFTGVIKKNYNKLERLSVASLSRRV